MTERNKETVRRLFDLQNTGDVRGGAALWAPDALDRGRRVDQKMMESVFATLYSLKERHSIHELIAEGEWVAVRTTCEGIHAGLELRPARK